MKVRAGMLRPRVAGTGWNAGFSRHSPPQAGGGTTSCAGMARLRVHSPGVATNRPRPYGPLCRLKPAFQVGVGSYCGSPRLTGSGSTSFTAHSPEWWSATKMWPL